MYDENIKLDSKTNLILAHGYNEFLNGKLVVLVKSLIYSEVLFF